ncbi:hypothetical protein RRG08_009952 [Elysia crispata]|uniref:Uncharacterized protein n=1 Tax=Elysia crispata TaxID=231223 RepID=A0AAE1ARE0_9GAST|nr:hypothetical protein RRG08_009952 [Elysia crispata]
MKSRHPLRREKPRRSESSTDQKGKSESCSLLENTNLIITGLVTAYFVSIIPFLLEQFEPKVRFVPQFVESAARIEEISLRSSRPTH